MSALAPTLQAFFTERLIRERRASPHTIAAYRDTLKLLLGVRRKAPAHASPPARHRRPRRAADRRVPRPPRARTRQQRPHPQRPPGGDPLAVPIRRAPPPRTPPRHRAGARDPAQALGPRTRHVPRPSTRSTRCSPRPTAPPGPAAATTRCCSPRSRPDCRASELTGLNCGDLHLGSRRRTSAAAAKAANNASPRSPRSPSRCYASGSQNATANPTDPLFPTSRGRRLSRDGLERRLTKHVSRRPPSAAPRCTTRTSRRTRSGTPPRCSSCTPASTPP